VNLRCVPRACRHALWVCGLVTASTANAQTTTLTITSGSTATFSNPTAADYVAGYIDGPTLTFTVLLNGGATGATHTTTVEVCASSASLGSGKALSNLLWQPSDGSKPWQAITTGCSGAINPSRVVGSQSLGKGASWSGGVRFRMLLNWNDTATSYGTPIEMTVAVSTP
jgi:hypothetical protein